MAVRLVLTLNETAQTIPVPGAICKSHGCTSGADTKRNSADNPCAWCDLQVIWHMAARLVLTLTKQRRQSLCLV